MRYATSLLIFLLTACATATPFKGPSGRAAYSLQCGAMVDACYTKAGEVCPNGYAIIDRATGTAAMPMYGGGFMMAPQHSLAIECK